MCLWQLTAPRCTVARKLDVLLSWFWKGGRVDNFVIAVLYIAADYAGEPLPVSNRFAAALFQWKTGRKGAAAHNFQATTTVTYNGGSHKRPCDRFGTWGG